MHYICTFPDCTKVAVNVLGTEGTQMNVQYILEQGLVSTVWVPKNWVSLRIHPAALSA